MTRVSGEGSAPALDGSALELQTVVCSPGAEAPVGDAERDTLLYVRDGEGALTLAAEQHPLAAGTAALVPAGATATVSCETPALVLVEAAVGGGVDLHAPLGAAAAVSRLDAATAADATGARSFQVLYGPHNGSLRATLFVGFIPPGRAPWHYHLYDEIVVVLAGTGRLHLRDAGSADGLAPGSAFRLRPREIHIVENLSETESLEVLGLFTPAGSPSAAYLDPDVLAEYVTASR